MSISSYTSNLASCNLNLLPALEVLLKERSVSAAAKEMGVSQSAMSHSLAKLRVLLEDPLLVPTGREMAVTPTGERIASELPPLMAALQATLSQRSAFDPRVAKRRFRIATYDYFEFTTLPDILRFLRTEAPGISLDIERLNERSIPRLVAGDIDLVMAGESHDMPASLRQRTLYREPFQVIARAKHPQLKGRLTLNSYTNVDHVLISVEGNKTGLVDRVLATQNASRHVALRVPNFSSAALAVMHSDMVCTLASSAAGRAKELYGLRVLSPPIDLPSIAVVAWWPQQHQQDPGSRWLRDILFSGRAVSPALRKLMGDHNK